jgi:hypothetical protein
MVVQPVINFVRSAGNKFCPFSSAVYKFIHSLVGEAESVFLIRRKNQM